MRKKIDFFLFSTLFRNCIELFKYLFLVQEVVILCEEKILIFFFIFIYFSEIVLNCSNFSFYFKKMLFYVRENFDFFCLHLFLESVLNCSNIYF